jgi:hypothetical protein
MAMHRAATDTNRTTGIEAFTIWHHLTAAANGAAPPRPRAPALSARALSALVMLGLVACGSLSGSEEQTFENRAEAVSYVETTFERLLPASATAVRQRRDLSSGRLWARFDFAAGDRPAVGAACEAQSSGLRAPASQARGIAWWPDMLAADTSAADEQFHFFECATDGRTGWLAVHRTVDMAVYWETGERAAR